MGSGVHFGAVSRDDEIAIKYYGHLPALLHDIDPLVDRSRDLLASLVAASENYDVMGVARIAEPVPAGETSDFETDGGVLGPFRKGTPGISRIAEVPEPGIMKSALQNFKPRNRPA